MNAISPYEASLIRILVSVETLLSVATLQSNNCSVEGDRSAIKTEINNLRAQAANWADDLNKLSSADRLQMLEEMSQHIQSIWEETKKSIDDVVVSYNGLKAMRELLRKAASEEAHAKFRVSTEMSGLSAASLRITEELSFIQSEREKLRFKSAHEFQPLPLPELLDYDSGFSNTSWKDLYNKASYENLYN